MTECPYYTVWHSLQTGRWCVVHKAPGCAPTVDVDCLTKEAAQALAASMNQQRECGWQIRNNFNAAGSFHPATH